MWSPTHVQVTVQRARGLLSKGKHGTNDAFVTIGLGKEKYQTSIKEKALESVEWHEKCELQIPKQGNTAEILLTVFHHNFLGVDEFLGCINIPLAEMDVYERPRNRWYKLKSKPGKDKGKEGKERGELEVKVAFIVKSGSLADLSKKEKHKSSLGQLSNALGGSLISISSLDKRKSLKKTLGKIGNKMKIKHKSKETVSSETGSLRDVNKLTGTLGDSMNPSQQRAGDADPGVISEGESEDDFTVSDQTSRNRRLSEAEGLSRTRNLSLRGLTDEDVLGGGSQADHFNFKNTNGISIIPIAGKGRTDNFSERSEQDRSVSQVLSNSYVHFEDLEYTKDFLRKERDSGSYSGSHNDTDNVGSGLTYIEELKENEFDKESVDVNIENEKSAVNNASSNGHSFTESLAVDNSILHENQYLNLNVMIGDNDLDSGATANVILSKTKNEPAFIEIKTQGDLNDCRLSDTDGVEDAFESLLQEDNDVVPEEVEDAFEYLLQTQNNAGCEEDVNIGARNKKSVEIHVTDKGYYNLSKSDKELSGCEGQGGFISYVFDDGAQFVDEFEQLFNQCDSKGNKGDVINEIEQLGNSKFSLAMGNDLTHGDVKEKQLNLNEARYCSNDPPLNAYIIHNRRGDLKSDSICDTILNTGGSVAKENTSKQITRSDGKTINGLTNGYLNEFVKQRSNNAKLDVTADKTKNQSNSTITNEIDTRQKPENGIKYVRESVCTASSSFNDAENVDNSYRGCTFEEKYSEISSSERSEITKCLDTKNNGYENSIGVNFSVSAYDSANKYSPEQIFTLNNDVEVLGDGGYGDESTVRRECSRGRYRLSGARLVDEICKSWQNLADLEDFGDIGKEQTMSTDVLDDLSHKGSGYSLETGANSTPKSGSLENLAGGEFLRKSDVPPAKPPRIVNPPEPVDEWEQKLYGKYGKEAMHVEPTGTLQRRINSFNPQAVSSPVVAVPSPAPPPSQTPTPAPAPTPVPAQATAPTEEISKPSEDKLSQDFKKSPTLSIPSKSSSIKSSMERIIIGGERENDFVSFRTPPSRLSSEMVKKFDGKSREELIEMVIDLQSRVSRQNQQQRDLEDYLDQLLLRVMETSPRILQNPYLNCKTQAKIM